MRLVLWICMFMASAAFAEEHLGPRLVQEEVRIPAAGGSYVIAATVLRPEGAGPFGAVVLNHGTPGSRTGRAKESAELLISSAAVFARRGYVVVMPLRRGFGATGGEFAEDPGTCANPDYRKGEQAAADDVMAAYEYARTLPYVDAKRMILAGQSAGGMVSMVAAGTRNPEGLVAVLGFAAGRGGNPDFRPGVPCAVEPVAQAPRIGRQDREGAGAAALRGERPLLQRRRPRAAGTSASPPAARAPSTCCSPRSGATATTSSARRSACATGCRRSSGSSASTASRSNALDATRRSSRSTAAARALRRLPQPLPRLPRVSRAARLRGERRRPLRLCRRPCRRGRCRGARVPDHGQGARARSTRWTATWCGPRTARARFTPAGSKRNSGQGHNSVFTYVKTNCDPDPELFLQRLCLSSAGLRYRLAVGLEVDAVGFRSSSACRSTPAPGARSVFLRPARAAGCPAACRDATSDSARVKRTWELPWLRAMACSTRAEGTDSGPSGLPRRCRARRGMRRRRARASSAIGDRLARAHDFLAPLGQRLPACRCARARGRACALRCAREQLVARDGVQLGAACPAGCPRAGSAAAAMSRKRMVGAAMPTGVERVEVHQPHLDVLDAALAQRVQRPLAAA